MTLGNKIYELRSAFKYSQEELANMLDVSRQSVSKWETDSAVPELDKLIKMCDVFNITLDELAGRAETGAHISQQKKQPDIAQRIIGYILLGAALLSVILIALFPYQLEFLIFFLPSVFICSFVCIFVKEKAAYWCLWTVPMVFSVMRVSFFTLHTAIFARIILLVIIAALIAAGQYCYKTARVKVTKQKGRGLICGWSAYLIAVIFLSAFYYFPSLLIDNGMVVRTELMIFLISHVFIACLAVLSVYTGCYLRSRKN